MVTAAIVLTLLSAAEHVYFFVLEAVLWQKPLGLKTFGMDKEKAATTAQLAVNQGFYNLFLAAGLLWAALGTPAASSMRLYTLGFVIAAAVVGGFTVSKRILLIQGIPAAAALACTLLAR